MSVIRIPGARLLRAVILAFSVGALALAVSVPAQANGPADTEAVYGSVTRVMNLGHTLMPKSQTVLGAEEAVMQSPDKVVKTLGVIPLPAGVELAPGEALHLNYADAVVVYEAISAACTITRVANNPIKYTASTPHRVTATHRVSLSTGCSSGGPVFGNLYRGTAPSGFSVDMKEVYGTPGVTTNFATYKNCQTTASYNYFSETAGISGVKTSSTVRLACF